MPIRTALVASLFSMVLVLGLAPSLAEAQQPSTSPLATDLSDSKATEVFVLGTSHLSGVADRFEPTVVDSLITVLDEFGPDAIGVEARSGRQIAAMERWGGRFDEVLDRFAGPSLHHGNLIREQVGWTWSEANRRADSLLTVARSDTMALGTDGRLALVQTLLAAYRLPTAALQWKYLSPESRSSQGLLPDTTAKDLNKRLTAANETYSIGLRLAHKRGHQRLYPIDDQTEKDLAADAGQTLMKAIGDSMRQEFDTHPVFQRADSLQKAGMNEGNLLPYYRYVNQEKVGRANVDLQWRTMLEVDLPNDAGRQWLALWETRNLHSVGHIQRMVSQHPGERVLVIVGSSHKPFYDTYLRQMMGVKVVGAEEVLSGV
jgi:hypothetical protein